jgi:hypothetical protein
VSGDTHPKLGPAALPALFSILPAAFHAAILLDKLNRPNLDHRVCSHGYISVLSNDRGEGIVIGKLFMVIILAFTFAGAFVAGLRAGETATPPAMGTQPSQSQEGLPGFIKLNLPPTDPTAKYRDAIRKATTKLPSEDIESTLRELQQKDYDGLLVLKLLPNVCEQIACQGIPAETVHRFVKSYLSVRIAEDNHATAVKSMWTSVASFVFAVFALVVSFLRKPEPTTDRTYRLARW